MTADNFTNVLEGLRQLQPFRVFTVEFHGGRRFEVDHPKALVVRDGVAVFLAPGGSRSGSTTRTSTRSSERRRIPSLTTEPLRNRHEEPAQRWSRRMREPGT
jgi:hypothetical protein